MIQQFAPLSGEFRLNQGYCYLDQHLTLLDKTLPVAQALHQYQPAISIEQWRTRLGMLRIRGNKSLLPLEKLSGGEQLKATLLALTHSPKPPRSYCLMNLIIILILSPNNY